MKKKAVLAYSGGLDTSFCVKYLSQDKKLDVHTICVNTGGFSLEQIAELEKRAIHLGSTIHKNIDVTNTYYRDCIRFLVYGNVLKNNTYPLSVSAERVFQALAVAEYATQVNADYLAHGSTGAGNDQIRFDMIFHIKNPDMEILTPIRDNNLKRDEEIDYLKKHGIELDWEKTEYSINQGLWGTSVGGKETLTSHQPLPEQAYPTAVTKSGKHKYELYFDKGQFSGFNGKKYANPVAAIKELNREAAAFGIGRDIHVGDTIIGIKGRVGFEAAAPILIIKAHEALEKHTLLKWQMHWKEQLANWYGMMLHEGQYLDPVMRDIEAFLEHSQDKVSGTVFMELAPYFFAVNGIESKHDLMSSSFGSYGEVNLAWDGKDARGFAKMLANANRIYYAVNGEQND